MESKGMMFVVVPLIVLGLVGAGLVLFILDGPDEGSKKYLAGDYTLEIFGNADGDWYLDGDDVEYLEGIIAGKKNETLFADVDRDGKIDNEDLVHLEKILDGTADHIWIVDGNGDPVKVRTPIERIGVEYLSNAELMNVLGVSDRVVAVDTAAYMLKDLYFPGRDLLRMEQMYSNPDFETIYDMDLDVIFTFSPTNNDVKRTNLPDTDIVFLGLYWPNVIEPQDSRFLQGVLKAGYLLGAQERAHDYVEWLLGIVDRIGSVTSQLTQEQKPSVLMTSYNRYFMEEDDRSASIYTRIDPLSQACMLAGGRPIAEDLDNWIGEGKVYGTTVDLEWIIEREPDFIFAHSVRYTYSGLTREPAHGYDCDDPSAFAEAVTEMRSRELLAEVPAVVSGHVYMTAGDFRNNAMGGVLGAAYLARVLHPDLFPDLDPVSIHQEFVTEWMELDYDLGSHGVFIAPAIT